MIFLMNAGSVSIEQEMAAPNQLAIIEAFYPGLKGGEMMLLVLLSLMLPLWLPLLLLFMLALVLTSLPLAPGTALAQGIFGEMNAWGRLPYTIYPSNFTKAAEMSMHDLRVAPGRTYRYYE